MSDFRHHLAAAVDEINAAFLADKPLARRPELGWPEYERRKQEWATTHPEATPAEYTAKMLRLARECGV